jgi:hypothetical protein
MPFYADLRTQAHLRYNLLVRLRKAYWKAIKAVEQGKAEYPFEFELREGGNTQKQSATERFIFRLWDRRTFVLAHAKEAPKSFTQNTIDAAKMEGDPLHQKETPTCLSLFALSPLMGRASPRDSGFWNYWNATFWES